MLKVPFVILCITLISSRCDTLDNGLARTPPMGWLAWERFTCQTDCKQFPDDCVNSDLFKAMADKLILGGYNLVGYQYVNIDDCWSEMDRTTDEQRLVPSSDRFPAGIKYLANHILKRGLKLGIYGDCGTKTCAGYPGQLKSESNYLDNYFEKDAATLADWEVDSFKFDGCNIDPFKAESICPLMSKALQATKRPILLSCEWPYYMLKANRSSLIDWPLVQSSCNTWRYYEDVEDSWLSIQSIIEFTIKMQSTIVKYHGPGSWFDPDQLVIGNFGLSLSQAQTQMAIWCIWSAPLYMSNDLRTIDPEMASLLKNQNLIAVNQDKLGVFGQMVAEDDKGWLGHAQAFVKPIEPIKNGCPSFAIVYLYRRAIGSSVKVSFKLRDILTRAPLKVAAERYRELYSGPGLGGSFEFAQCLEKLTRAMLRPKLPVGLIPDRSDAIEETYVKYDVFDLIESQKLDNVGLNETLDLIVVPSGVRAVRLEEIS